MASSFGWKASLTTLVRRHRTRRPAGRRRLPRFDCCEPRTLMTTGAIYTTLSTGATVNANIYDSKDDVYLNGGPQNTNSQGLTPGTYYFQVTNPSGSLLLSTDPAAHRVVVVNEFGVFANDQPLTTHNLGSFNAANQSRPVQLMPFDDTDNPGGEYKAWLISTAVAEPRTDDPLTGYDESRILDFEQGADVKTDNFKVKYSLPDQSVVSLGGQKFEDIDGDGVFDAGESGLAGFVIHIQLTLPDGSTIDLSDTTSTAGMWSVQTALPVGVTPDEVTFTAQEVQQPAYTQTAPTEGQTTADATAAGFVWSGQFDATTGNDSATGLDFGNFKEFCLSGTKYEDMTGDGATVGDPGLGGFQIFVDLDNDGTYDELEPTATTDESGNWLICDLGPGLIGTTVYEVQKDGYTQTLGMAGYTVTGTSGADQAGLDFANFETVTITGLKYYDYDGNGVWANTAVEPAIAGWTLYIDANNNGVKDDGEACASTDANGDFQFSNLGPGTYRVREVLPANWSATQGSGGYEILVGGAGVPSGGTASGYRFGNFKFTPVTGGFTLGFWSNKNGLSRILKTYGSEAAAVADLSNNLNLRNPDGSPFNPATLAAFQTWLLNASATNMQSMLSAQLAATYLNVKSGSMNGNAIIQLSASFAGSTYAQILQAGGAHVVNGCISVNDLMAAANQALSVNTPTIRASAARTYQEAMKNLLDALNNNGTASGVSLKFVIAVDPTKVQHVDTDGDGVNDRHVVTLGTGI